MLTGSHRYLGVCSSRCSRCILINISLYILLNSHSNSGIRSSHSKFRNHPKPSNSKLLMSLRHMFRSQRLVSDKHTINSSSKMLGRDLSNLSYQHTQRPISHILQTGPTNLLERDTLCAILRDQGSGQAVHLPPLSLASVPLASPTGQIVKILRLQRPRLCQKHLRRAFLPARHCRSANTDRMAVLRTQERGSSQASAIFRTSPAQARSTRHCQLKKISKRKTVHPITRDLSWPDIYRDYTLNIQRRDKLLTRASYTDTPTRQKVDLTKMCTRATVSGQRRDHMARLRHRCCLGGHLHLAAEQTLSRKDVEDELWKVKGTIHMCS